MPWILQNSIMAKEIMEFQEKLHEETINEEIISKKITDSKLFEERPPVENKLEEDNYLKIENSDNKFEENKSKVDENKIKVEESNSKSEEIKTEKNHLDQDESLSSKSLTVNKPLTINEETSKEQVFGTGKDRISKKETQGFKNIIEKDSIQFNSQDLEQEQNVDVNPVQVNSQNIHIHVHENKNYSSKITGTTYLERNRNILRNVKIYLFFGYESHFPVYETISDNNGNFTIEDIPPGYYILIARYDGYEYRSHYIKVLPCQNIHHSVLLR